MITTCDRRVRQQGSSLVLVLVGVGVVSLVAFATPRQAQISKAVSSHYEDSFDEVQVEKFLRALGICRTEARDALFREGVIQTGELRVISSGTLFIDTADVEPKGVDALQIGLGFESKRIPLVIRNVAVCP